MKQDLENRNENKTKKNCSILNQLKPNQKQTNKI